MLPVQTKTYHIFNWALAIVEALIVVVYFGLFLNKSLGPIQVGTSIYTTSIGIAHLLYMVSLYRPLSRRSLVGASLIGTVLFVSNIALLILSSGGFGSPYFGLWLVLILAIGIYRPSVPLGLLMLTTIYFVGLLLTQEASTQAVTDSAVALASAFVSGGLGFWLWHTHHTKLGGTTDTTQLAEQLTQEQVKSEILLHHIGDGVVVVDRELRIQLLNPAGSALSGWSVDEAKGIDYHLVMPLLDEDDNQLKADSDIFNRVIQSQRAITRDDVVLMARSGRKIALSITASPIFAAGNQVSGAIAVFKDISQTKSAERQRNEFISTASHEMRTPVAAVEGYIALALNPKVSQINDAARKYLLKAQNSTQHLGKLFQDLLAITRIEEGKLPNKPEVVDMGRLIEQLMDELKFKVGTKQINLNFKSLEQTGAIKSLRPIYYVYADPERIREVIANLVDNAIKFTPTGEVSLTLDGDSKQVIIGVKDTGIGISAEDLPHLFQKFYRSGSDQTQATSGTGLGLYIARAIVEMNQGRIWAESTPGKGSNFKFSLPRLSYKKAQALQKPSPANVVNPSAGSLGGLEGNANANGLVASLPSHQVE